jgi:phage repressor protein C with HTH and peptisase S24 domain
MGSGVILRDQPGEIQELKVSAEWVSKNIKRHSGVNNLCIVTGFGTSMAPLYNPGDPLIIDRGIKTVEADAVYFFRVGEEGFIKILQRVPGEGIRVISKNKDYESWTIRADMDFEVFGLVLKAWSGTDVW